MLFKEIVGHNKLKNRLIQTVLDQRISHAQLFLGAEGSEKLALAIAYAQFIACKNKQIQADDSDLLADSCGNCPSCIKYQKLVHPDLHFIFPVATTRSVTTKPTSDQFIKEWREALLQSNYYLDLNDWYSAIDIENKQGRIGVDDANNVIKVLGLRAYEGEYKVMIIWMVEKLYHAAAPKLLKILEEPPEKTLFILISEDSNQILKTILSRTQLVKLQSLNAEEIRHFLIHNFQLNGSKIEHIVNLAEGNFKNIFPLLTNKELQLPYFDDYRTSMQLAYQRNFIGLKKQAEELSKIGRENIKQFLQYGLRITRLCLYQDIGNTEMVKASGIELEFIQKFSRFVNQQTAPQITDILNEAITHIERNVNPKIVLMDSFLKIAGIFIH
jgi:DNA polymerase-3 subunit delta'